ncbi:MAG: DUF1844 domain-containing protein [bacterium]|jgi:hypothetical protein
MTDEKNRNDEERERPRFVVEDKRFARDDEDEEPETPASAPASRAAETGGDTRPGDARGGFEVIGEPQKAPGEGSRLGLSEEDERAIDEELRQAFREMTPEDEERLRKAAREQIANLSRLGIENYLRDTLNVAYMLSLQYLGLQPNLDTNLTSRDMKRAALCIDLIDFLGKRLADFLTAQEREQIAALVSALKLEFAKLPPRPPAPPKGK